MFGKRDRLLERDHRRHGGALKSCSGRATDVSKGQSESQGIPCDMPGGPSGGPWLIGSGSGGSQNSINSFGYNNVPNTMFGPYWGSVDQSAYISASSSSLTQSGDTADCGLAGRSSSG